MERLTDISQSGCPDEGICLLGDTRLQFLYAELLYCLDVDKCAKLFYAKNLTLSGHQDRLFYEYDGHDVFIYSAVQSPSATAESFAIGARLAEMMLENAKLDDFKGITFYPFFCQV